MTLYKEVSVWRRLGPSRSVRYVCFEQLGKSLYCVQSADFYTVPISPNMVQEDAARFLELLTEEPPATRCAWFSTLEAAISEHDREFGAPISNRHTADRRSER